MTARANEVRTGRVARLELEEWQLSALIACGLVLLPFLIFWAETLAQRVFYYHDLQYYFLPYHQLVADYLRRGDLPLWNPYAFSGIPLLGDGQTAIFYPPNWLFLFLPATAALNYVVLSQFSLAGVGMFHFTRNLGLSRVPAALAALAYMFNGYLATRFVHLSIMSGAAMIPFVFWGIDRFRAQPSPGRFALAALVVAIQAVAGHPQVPIYTAIGVGLYVLVQEQYATRRGKLAAMRRDILWLALIYIVGYSLAAIQLLPWIDFARLSPRAAGASYGLVAFHSVIGLDWLLLIFPYLYGGVKTGLFHPAPPFLPDGIYIWERAAYIGILPLALASVALLGLMRREDDPLAQRRGLLLALIAVLGLGLLIAAGRGTPFGWLVYVTPVIGKLRAYSRAIVLVAFVVPVLAALGLQQIIDLTHSGKAPSWLSRRLLLVTATFCLLFGIALAYYASVGPLGRGENGRPAANLLPTRPATLVQIAWTILTVGLLAWWSTMRLGRSALLAVAVVGADLGVFAAAFNPTTDASEMTGAPPSVAFLQQDRSLYRVATFIVEEKISPSVARSQLAMSWSMVFGISHINGFNSLQPRRYTDVLFGPQVGDVSYGFLAQNALLQPSSNTLSLLNTKYVLVQPGVNVRPGRDYDRVYSDETVTIYRNARVYPRAYFVSEVHDDADQAKAYSILIHPTFDPRSEAVVEADLDENLVASLSVPPTGSEATLPTRTRPRIPAEEGLSPDLLEDQGPVLRSVVPSGRATVEPLSPNRLRVTTSTERDRFLVLSEMYVPGWYASIDGQPTEIYRANYLLRGLIVPAGEHTIELEYRPRSAIFGAILSAVTALGLLALVQVGRERWLRLGRASRRHLQSVRGERFERPAAFLLAILFFLLVAYRPARDFFRSTGDVFLYQKYAQEALSTPAQLPREYPPLSTAIFVLPQLVSANYYMLAFAILAALVTWVTVLVVDRISGRGWSLVAFLALGAGGTLFFRYDIWVVLLTVLAFAAMLRKHWFVAQAFLAVGVALKLYPVILMPLVVIWQWRSERRIPLQSALSGLALFVVSVGSMRLIAPAQLGGMLRYHGNRPLEFESLGASVAWLIGPTGAEFTFGSWNVTSSSSPTIITLFTIANVLLLLSAYGLFLSGRLSAAAGWALTLIISLLTSKVFSTQYLLWVLPFAVLAATGVGATSGGSEAPSRRWTRRFLWLWAIICVLTSLIYPFGLERYAVPTMVANQTPGWMMTLVTLRNTLLLVAAGVILRFWTKKRAP